MASLAESSLGSVAIEEIRAAQQRLNNYKQPNHDTQVDGSETARQERDSDANATTTTSSSEGNHKAATVPESIEPSTRVPIDSLPRTRKMMLNVSRTAPREMLALVGEERLAIPKAVSFSQYEGGDTQPWDSQDVVESSKSMIALGQTTPQRARAASDSTPNTYNSGLDTDQSMPIVLGIDNMSPPTSQARRDFMDNDTQMPDLSRGETSPTTSQVERDILRDDTQPRTQLGMRDVPATPAMAGNKHGRDGEILTSAATVTKTPHNFTQLFGGGEKPPVMSNTQLFGVADSSPAIPPPHNVAHSDPIQSRPSPNVNGSTTLSSPPFTSPIMHMQPGPAPSRALGDPITRYRPMAESQKEARDRLRRKRGGNLEDHEDLDESPEFRTIRGQSTADGLSNFKAPLRPGSASKVIDLSDTIKTPITERRWNQFVDHAAGEQPAVEEDEEQLPETQDLPQEPDVEYSERDEPPELDTLKDGGRDEVEEEENEVEEDDEGNDEYDEFGQTLRSQSQFEIQYEEDALANGHPERLSAQQPNSPTGHRNTLGTGREDTRRSTQSTQVSAIADSQPTVQQSGSRSAERQAVQYSSYIPGSQHQGKTSEEMALLYTPQASNQSRVLASQLHVEESDETDITGVKIPSSPPLALHDDETMPEDSAEASIVRRDLLKQFQSDADRTETREVPESDTPETLAHQEESVPLYSTARTHVSGSGQSPAKPSAGTPPRKTFGSQRSRLTDQSPAVPRFADVNAHASLSLVTDNSFGNELNSQNVRELVDGFYTAEDQMVHELMSDDHGKSPRRKRVKRSHPVRSLRRGSPTRLGNVDRLPEHELEVPAVQGSVASDNLGMVADSSEAVQSGLEGQPSSEPAFMEMVGGESSISHVQRDRPTLALMDTPNKANQMPPGLADDEDEKAGETMSESVRLREEAGSAAVSQLVATRTGAAGKRSKQATYARGSRRKLNATAAGRLRRQRAPATVESDDDKDDDVVADAEDGAIGADQGHDEGTRNTDAAISTIEPRPAAGQSSEADEPIDNAMVDVDTLAASVDTGVVAGDRVWAMFRGRPQYLYTATWLGTSPDGMTYKIKFDDQTVTNIDYFQVRRLELRVGDVVKVDEPDKRKKNWVVVGFGPVATTDAERALGTDIFGHTHVKIQHKGNRESLPKTASSDTDADEVHTVLINYLYLTLTMWPHYKGREFEPPSRASSARAETPGSGDTSAAATPGSRSGRAAGPSGKGKASRASHLRETSVASTSSASPNALFSGMAFAISYFAAGEEKKVVTEMIQRNGGIILEDGFEELFNLPDIGSVEVVSPSKKSPRKKDDALRAADLQLNAKYKNLKFAALIADRHSRRAKYMQALALGLPTVSGRWIVHSLDESKNPSSGNVGPLAWDRYLLPAGESTFLNAVRSRNLTPYDATAASLAQTIENRACLLKEEGLILVAPKTGSVNWEKRKTFAFLTMACGAGPVKRVHDIQEAKELMLGEPDVWKWVYIDTSVAEAERVLFGRGGNTATIKKRKRAAGDAAAGSASGEEKMSATDGVVKIVNDEFVIQSLILEALVE